LAGQGSEPQLRQVGGWRFAIRDFARGACVVAPEAPDVAVDQGVGATIASSSWAMSGWVDGVGTNGLQTSEFCFNKVCQFPQFTRRYRRIPPLRIGTFGRFPRKVTHPDPMVAESAQMDPGPRNFSLNLGDSHGKIWARFCDFGRFPRKVTKRVRRNRCWVRDRL
jgi:hypothetical protein